MGNPVIHRAAVHGDRTQSHSHSFVCTPPSCANRCTQTSHAHSQRRAANKTANSKRGFTASPSIRRSQEKADRRHSVFVNSSIYFCTIQYSVYVAVTALHSAWAPRKLSSLKCYRDCTDYSGTLRASPRDVILTITDEIFFTLLRTVCTIVTTVQ